MADIQDIIAFALWRHFAWRIYIPALLFTVVFYHCLKKTACLLPASCLLIISRARTQEFLPTASTID